MVDSEKADFSQSASTRPTTLKASSYCPLMEDSSETASRAQSDGRFAIGANSNASLGTSPQVSSATAHDDHYEDSSFGLLNSSFDTLSDAGGTFGMGGDFSVLTPSKNGRSSCGPAVQGSPTHDAENKIVSLPNLKSQRDIETTEMSVGDISPIKLVYSSSVSLNETRNEPRHHDHVFPPLMFPVGAQNDASVIPADWRDDIDNFNINSYRSNPFFVLRSSRKALENVKYLLPCLRLPTEVCQVNVSGYGSIRQYKEKQDNEELSSDLSIATRRVEAAICAFGGTLHSNRNQQAWSIFRHRGGCNDARRHYDLRLPSRYYLSGSRISWDVEENPHVDISVQETDTLNVGMPNKKTSRIDNPKNDHSDNSSGSSSATSENQANLTTDELDAKMKYRCKLCGQLKQNHNCPYHQPLQRSIGVMVYPAVNSYTAAEPGAIAPALTKMNNFVTYDSDQGSPQPESQLAGGNVFAVHPSTITPETLRGGTFFHSPQSSLSAQSSEDAITSRHTTVPAMQDARVNVRGYKRPHTQPLDHVSSRSESVVRNSPFVASVTLRPEHYRAVSPSKKATTESEQGAPTTTSVAYQYPAIPLTFAERKRLSDSLFYLSKKIPSLTSDCAVVLRDARQNNEWDLAVAELLAQVIVGLYCGEGDIRLEGLQQYLLALGISC